MKISIITIHGIANFGSVFQSYALCRFLKDNGYSDVELIDYNPPYYTSSSIRAIVGRLLNFKAYKKRTQKFRRFIEEQLPLTKTNYHTLEELEKADFNSDVYIAGGDQLWNVYHACGEDDAYKLTFVKGKKISYATSMGQSKFSEEQLCDLAEKIKEFNAVSVRESSSVDLLKSKGIQATHCVDPVYLLEPSVYNEFLTPVNQPKYLLVYLVTPSKLLDRCVEYLSKKYQLKVILCSGFAKKCQCDEMIKDVGPNEILSYIKNAEIVLSSSFHATAFSLIFEKQFYTILPEAQTNERILDLLAIRGLKERIVTEDSDIEAILDSQIDYTSIKKYDEFINNSKEYLLQAIK